MPKVHLPDGRIVHFPDAMAPEQIGAEVEKLAGSASPPAQEPSGRSWTDTAVDALPTIGGALGGLAGGIGGTVAGFGVGGVPGAIGGAAAGGAAGEGFKQSINALRGKGALLTPGQAMTGIGTQAAVQGGTEAVGAGVGRLMSGAAKGLYRGALRPSAAIRAKTPDVVERGLADRILVGPRNAQSKALAGVRSSKAEADAAVAATNTATPVTSREVRQGLMPEMDRAKREIAAGLPDSRRAIAARAQTLPKSVDLQEAHSIARTLNDVADPAFKAANRGGAPVSLDARMNKGLATAYSGAVKDRVPGLAQINKTTSDRMGLSKALRAAAERPSVLANVVAGGAGASELFRSGGDPGNALAAALMVKGVSSPRSLSGAALALNEIGRHSGVSANAIRAALFGLMKSHDEK